MALDRVKSALDLLDRAVGRLDRAVEARLARDAAAADTRRTDDAGAFELHALETALAEAREGERQAKARVAELSGRLDGAIGKLRLVLEE